MNSWKRLERGLHHVGPYWLRFFGEDISGTVFAEPNAEGRFAWYVADGQKSGAKTFRQGLAQSIDEAKLSADAAVLDRKRGRAATIEGEPTTSTERNRRRVDRLLALEDSSRKLLEELRTFYQELILKGEIEAADRIARLMLKAAMSGLADYMRRAARFRSASGSQISSAEELQSNEEAVLEAADEIDALSEDPSAGFDAFEAIANKLRKMGAFPEPELYSTVVQSFELRD